MADPSRDGEARSFAIDVLKVCLFACSRVKRNANTKVPPDAKSNLIDRFGDQSLLNFIDCKYSDKPL